MTMGMQELACGILELKDAASLQAAERAVQGETAGLEGGDSSSSEEEEEEEEEEAARDKGAASAPAPKDDRQKVGAKRKARANIQVL
jgi:hypothetical protein